MELHLICLVVVRRGAMFRESYPSKTRGLRAGLILFAGAFVGSCTFGGQFPNAKAQISQQAAYSAAKPSKVSAKVLAQEITVGDRPEVQIDMLNLENQLVAVPRDVQCDVMVHFASGKITTQTAWIKKGQTTVGTNFLAQEAGFVFIVAEPQEEGIRSDKIVLIVHPAQKSSKKSKVPQGASNESRPTIDAFPLESPVNPINPSFRSVSLRVQGDPLNAKSSAKTNSKRVPSAPILHISLSDANGIYHANGTDAAVISVLFESPDYSPAPVDIHIWFQWTNGSFVPAQPLTIKKGTFSAVTHLSSPSPAEVHLRFISSSPTYQVQGETDVTLHFVPVGAALVGPERLSVVDNSPVMLVFYDANQNPVAPGKNWPVTLRCRQSKLHFTPASFEVPAASPSGSAVLFPVSWGSDTVEAVVANYAIKPLALEITGWMILWLCLGGGMAGGLAAYNKFKGSWIWRLFLGVLGGATLCWLYVYLALPNVDVNIAHNTFSVFFVGLLGGYGGTSILDLAAKKLGWITS